MGLLCSKCPSFQPFTQHGVQKYPDYAGKNLLYINNGDYVFAIVITIVFSQSDV